CGKRLKVMLPVLFCICATLLAACGGGSSGPSTTKAPASQQIFVSPVAGQADLKTFDPGLATDIPSINAIDMIFTGLVQLNDKLQLVDQLAASHSVGSDGTTWTFTLKPNLKFSDSTQLTSADVAYSIDRALDPKLKSSTAPAYLNLVKDSALRNSGKLSTLIGDSLLTPDPNTVVIKTSRKAAYFLDALAYPSSYVVEKSMIQKYGNNFADHLAEGIGGDGPFKVSKYTHNKEIDFVPNPNYYGPEPQLSKVVMPFYVNAGADYPAYKNDQVDTAGVPTEDISAAKALPNHQYQQYPELVVDYIAMNYLVKPFDNIKVRQAFALALNKDELVNTVYKGTRVATNHIVPNGMPGYDTNLKGPDGTTNTAGNTALAKQLFQQGLQEEGLTVQKLPPITFTVTSEGSADRRNWFAAEQQMWQNTLGVTIKVDDIDFDKLLSEISSATGNAKGLQMWEINWVADYPDAQDWLTLQFDKGASNNNMSYGQNSTSDATTQQQTQRTLEQADQNLDPTGRLQQYNQAEQQLVNDVAWLPEDQRQVSSLNKPCVVGLVNNAQSLTPPDDWGQIYKTTATPCANVSQYQ
ncbi:MAG TPA: peptide ABC transporter substrate-binding protein, partial [Ktedonobacteraceae bacterium]